MGSATHHRDSGGSCRVGHRDCHPRSPDLDRGHPDRFLYRQWHHCATYRDREPFRTGPLRISPARRVGLRAPASLATVDPNGLVTGTGVGSAERHRDSGRGFRVGHRDDYPRSPDLDRGHPDESFHRQRHHCATYRDREPFRTGPLRISPARRVGLPRPRALQRLTPTAW